MIEIDFELDEEDFEWFGFTWKFEVVKNYKIGANLTDQADFVTLKNGIFTPRVFSEHGEASIGRTPIIRVTLLDGTNIVEVAYIRVFISGIDLRSDLPAQPGPQKVRQGRKLHR